MSTLNSQHAIHDAAASLHWQLAQRVGVSRANQAVIDSGGHCLLNQPFSKATLSAYKFEDSSGLQQPKFTLAVAAEAHHFARHEVNMNGMIYVEDAPTGRSPGARDIDATVLRAIPREIIGAEVQKIGSLCLRHPMPAVVFTSTAPMSTVIEVADTQAALGFHLPMFMGDIECRDADEDLYVLTGIFHIPVPDIKQSSLWDGAILNSTRFVEAITFVMDGGSHTVSVRW